jgi:RimJ/RimL family protein N-acetyltransferase
VSAAQEPPIISIRGERVGLGPLERSTIPVHLAGINDFPVTRGLGGDARPRTLAEIERWYERRTTHDAAVSFGLYDLEDMAFAGNVGLFDIDRRHGTCELGVMIMPRERQGHGLGTEATVLITDYAIHALGMHNVRLAVLAFNVAGIRAYRKAGFHEYGRRREAWLHNGRRWDIVYMDVIASEWESPVMARLMAPDDER